MKTLKINLLKPANIIKSMKSKNVVNISYELNNKIYSDIAAYQSSLDYIASNYNVKFDFIPVKKTGRVVVTCTKGRKTAQKYLDTRKDRADIISEIYKTASKVL